MPANTEPEAMTVANEHACLPSTDEASKWDPAFCVLLAVMYMRCWLVAAAAVQWINDLLDAVVEQLHLPGAVQAQGF